MGEGGNDALLPLESVGGDRIDGHIDPIGGKRLRQISPRQRRDDYAPLRRNEGGIRIQIEPHPRRIMGRQNPAQQGCVQIACEVGDADFIIIAGWRDARARKAGLALQTPIPVPRGFRPVGGRKILIEPRCEKGGCRDPRILGKPRLRQLDQTTKGIMAITINGDADGVLIYLPAQMQRDEIECGLGLGAPKACQARQNRPCRLNGRPCEQHGSAQGHRIGPIPRAAPFGEQGRRAQNALGPIRRAERGEGR